MSSFVVARPIIKRRITRCVPPTYQWVSRPGLSWWTYKKEDAQRYDSFGARVVAFQTRGIVQAG